MTITLKSRLVFIPTLFSLCCCLHSCAINKGSLQPLKDNISIIHLSGTPQEIGTQHGTLLKENIKKAIQDAWDYVDFIVPSKDDILSKAMIRGALYGTAKKYLPYIPEEYITEMKALAESAGVTFDDILLINTGPETPLEAASVMKSGFCTSTVLNNEMTIDGSLFHSYNEDIYFPPSGITDKETHYKKVRFFDKYKVVYFYRPQNGNSFTVSFVCGFINAFAGMNEHGICISLVGPPPNSKLAMGMPVGFQIRSILQKARTLIEAIDMAKSARWTLEGQIAISDGKTTVSPANRGKTNNAVLIDFGPDKCDITELKNGKLSEGFGGNQMNKLLSTRGYDKKLTLDLLINRLRYQPYDWDGICSKATAYSMVFHPSTRRFWVAIGNAPAPTGTYFGFDLMKQSRLTKDTDNFHPTYPYNKENK
ncbi:MAG: C45 family peptidase [Planctomycetota bacterium]